MPGSIGLQGRPRCAPQAAPRFFAGDGGVGCVHRPRPDAKSLRSSTRYYGANATRILNCPPPGRRGQSGSVATQDRVGMLDFARPYPWKSEYFVPVHNFILSCDINSIVYELMKCFIVF